MKTGSYIQFNTADYPQQYSDLMQKLAQNLNNNLETLYNALNNQLTFSDNLSSGIQTITVTVDATGTPTSGATFQIGTTTTNNNVNTTKLSGLIVINAINQASSNTYPTTQPFISFTQSGNTINIQNISGLQASQSYQLNVITVTS